MKTGELYIILQLLSSITQFEELQFLQFFRRIPELLQFFLRSVVYNLNNCTVHNIGSST